MSSVYDLAELGRLWQEYQPRLLAMLERRIDPALRARVGPEDVLSDAFLAGQRRWPEFRRDDRTYPLICTVGPMSYEAQKTCVPAGSG